MEKKMKVFNLICRKKFFCILTFSLFAFLTESAVCGQPKTRDYWPTNGWRSSTPEKQGMDSAKLMIADEFIRNRLPDAFSLLVVKNGYLVFEKYYSWGSREKYAVVHSVTKSVTSALIGIALDAGYLNSVDQKLIEFFPEYWVKESTNPKIQAFSNPIYGTFSYGYQWWIKEVDGCFSYRAWGRRGQFIVIVPELDLVIAVTSETAQPHPPTSIHYSPLFDLVAASVQRKRPLKKSLKAVELPADVKAFITHYNQAIFTKDVVTMADLISDRFLHDGVTKQMALNFLSATLSHISEAKIIITKFEPKDDEAKMDVWLKDKYFEAPFMTGSKLIKETGHWKWYGNQDPKHN